VSGLEDPLRRAEAAAVRGPHSRRRRLRGPVIAAVAVPLSSGLPAPAVGIGWAGRAGAHAGAKLRSVRNFSTAGETRTGENWRSSPVSLHHRRQHQWVPLDRCRRCHPPSGASAGASSPPGPQKAPKHGLCGPWSDHRPSSGSSIKLMALRGSQARNRLCPNAISLTFITVMGSATL
jgi:hypothetical protein